MKLSMLKFLIATTLLSTSVSAKSIEEFLIKFEKQRVANSLERMDGELNKATVVLKKDLKQNNWIGYTIQLDFTLKGKQLSQKDVLFTNGKMISFDLIDMKTKRSFKSIMYPKLSKKYFNKEHFIAGNPKAKHTIVLFSDPLCIMCIDAVPFILKKVIDNPDNIAVYYYNLPLKMHPTATTVAKAAIIAAQQGIQNIDYKIYNANLPEKYKFNEYQEKNQAKVLGFFNKEFGTHITMKQINDPKLAKILKDDSKMSEDAFVTGTPTLFFDGEYDITRSKFEKYLK